MEPIITIKDVVKEYITGEVKIKAADGITFDVNKGELVVVLGPSGAAESIHRKSDCKNPTLLLCDEPTGALDYVTGKSILKLLRDANREFNKTVMIITHNSSIAQMADKVVKIKNGKVEHAGQLVSKDYSEGADEIKRNLDSYVEIYNK